MTSDDSSVVQSQGPCHYNYQCAMFTAQVFFSFIVMMFCMAMIFWKDGQLEVFLPLLTSTASVWVPSPQVPRKQIKT